MGETFQQSTSRRGWKILQSEKKTRNGTRGWPRNDNEYIKKEMELDMKHGSHLSAWLLSPRDDVPLHADGLSIDLWYPKEQHCQNVDKLEPMNIMLVRGPDIAVFAQCGQWILWSNPNKVNFAHQRVWIQSVPFAGWVCRVKMSFFAFFFLYLLK